MLIAWALLVPAVVREFYGQLLSSMLSTVLKSFVFDVLAVTTFLTALVVVFFVGQQLFAAPCSLLFF